MTIVADDPCRLRALLHETERYVPISNSCNIALDDLAFMINGPPQVHRLTIELHGHHTRRRITSGDELKQRNELGGFALHLRLMPARYQEPVQAASFV